MAQEQLKSEELQARVQEAVKSIDKPSEVLETSLKKLEKFGGFDMLESAIDSVQNVNPERKARKKYFLKSLQRSQKEKL